MSTLKIITLIAFLISGVLYQPSLTEADNVAPHKSPQGYIRQYAKEYGVSQEFMLRVAKCESGFKQSAIGDNNHAFGLFQYWNGTWNSFTDLYGQELDIHSYQDQAKLTAWAFSKGLQNHWTCAKK